MSFLPEEFNEYIEGLLPPEAETLHKLDRETNLNVPYPNMLTGHVQGRFLAFMSRLLRPKRILEIGTYTGYSAICLAEGLAEKGELITIDKNPEVAGIAVRYFEQAGLGNVITRIEGDALEIIPSLEGTFDLVFLDADKENYPEYLDIVLEKLSPGGLIMIDNTLWGGKVLRPAHSGDRETEGIQKLNKMLSEDPKLESFLLPLRDGITLVRPI
ncbi:MAG: O-methyltransferase [Bacteroidales bacterium]|jgi:predicted O-methyltransferase YrrM|nr:O-methyltransferase [Bacteroidales bacterium]